MFALGLNCDCIRDPGLNRFGNIVSHLLIAAKQIQAIFLYGGGGGARGLLVLSVYPLKPVFFRLLCIGLLKQAKVLLLSSQMVFFPWSVQEGQSDSLLSSLAS